MASLLWASRDIRVNGRRLSYSSALPALESPALLNSLGSTIPIINNSRYTNRPLARTEDLLAGGSRALGFRAPGFHREPTTRDSATCTGQGYRDAPDWTTVGPIVESWEGRPPSYLKLAGSGFPRVGWIWKPRTRARQEARGNRPALPTRRSDALSLLQSRRRQGDRHSCGRGWQHHTSSPTVSRL